MRIVMQLYVVYVRNAVINTLFLVLRRVVLVLFNPGVYKSLCDSIDKLNEENVWY